MPGILRRSIRCVLVAALLSCSLSAPDVAAQSCGADFRPPSTVTLPDALRPLVGAMLENSPTFHQQWRTLVGVSELRLRVVFNSTLAPDRAQTTIVRYEYGLMVAVVELPMEGHRVELLAHEFEHVIEQIEGVDLRRARHDRVAGVHDLGDAFETQRAYDAGRQVAREWDRVIYAKGTPQPCPPATNLVTR
jgi:hypothetical protein